MATDKQDNQSDETKKNEISSSSTDKQKKTKSTEVIDEKSDKPSLFKRYPLTFILLGLLIIATLWGYFNGKAIERKLTKAHQTELAERSKNHALQIGKIFSWGIRSEVTRNNMEQAEQYMLSLVREPNIEKVTYVNAKDFTILYSTNKAEEGEVMNEDLIKNANETTVSFNQNKATIISPVMGIDSKLGILVIEMK